MTQRENTSHSHTTHTTHKHKTHTTRSHNIGATTQHAHATYKACKHNIRTYAHESWTHAHTRACPTHTKGTHVVVRAPRHRADDDLQPGHDLLILRALRTGVHQFPRPGALRPPVPSPLSATKNRKKHTPTKKQKKKRFQFSSAQPRTTVVCSK